MCPSLIILMPLMDVSSLSDASGSQSEAWYLARLVCRLPDLPTRERSSTGQVLGMTREVRRSYAVPVDLGSQRAFVECEAFLCGKSKQSGVSQGGLRKVQATCSIHWLTIQSEPLLASQIMVLKLFHINLRR